MQIIVISLLFPHWSLITFSGLSNSEQLNYKFTEKEDLNSSIVKDSNADLGVNFKIVQNRPKVEAVCTKFQKNFFAYLPIF